MLVSDDGPLKPIAAFSHTSAKMITSFDPVSLNGKFWMYADST